MPSPDEMLSRAPRVLSREQKEFYLSSGYLLLERFLSAEWLARLRRASADFIEESRTLRESNAKLDLEPDHRPENPRLRRLTSPVDHHPVFRELSFEGPIVDIAEDLLGPDVRFHHSKLNYKWADGGQEVKWHQDIQYWPHTDFSPLTIGVYLEDVDDEMGPMAIVPGSHLGELFDLYDDRGQWSGAIGERDLPRARTGEAIPLKGPAGSVTVHHCCAVHGSLPNRSPRSRPLLLQTYSAGDSYPLLGIGTNGAADRTANVLVRGARQRWMTIGSRRLPVAPDWSKGGYRSIFAVQRQDDRR
jgi:ectoine hydroxylase-related dioxygenase (phytanoyl-CoA dioxygenase family)